MNGRTYRIATSGDIIQHFRMRVQRRVDEANRAFACLDTLSVDECEKGRNSRCCATSAEDLRQLAEYGNAEPSTIGSNVRESYQAVSTCPDNPAFGDPDGPSMEQLTSHGTAVVVLTRVVRRIFVKILCNSGGLVRR